jgi:hypothetical protein
LEQETSISGKFLEELRKIIYELTGNYYPDERLMLLAKKLNMFLEDKSATTNKSATKFTSLPLFKGIPQKRSK